MVFHANDDNHALSCSWKQCAPASAPPQHEYNTNYGLTLDPSAHLPCRALARGTTQRRRHEIFFGAGSQKNKLSEGQQLHEWNKRADGNRDSNRDKGRDGGREHFKCPVGSFRTRSATCKFFSYCYEWMCVFSVAVRKVHNTVRSTHTHRPATLVLEMAS